MTTRTTGRLCVVTRRHVHVWTGDGEILEGTLASKLEPCVGDLVEYQPSLDGKPCSGRSIQVAVQRLLPRTSCLQRSSAKKTKLLAANVDRLFLIAAPSPMINTEAVDRVLVAALYAGVPTTLVINKIDLIEEYERILGQLQIYRALGYSLLEVSVQQGTGLTELRASVIAKENEVVAFTGVSGVGKSSLLNALLPGADVRTQEVSRKTGQGQQTTSQAIGHRLDRPGQQPLMVVDLPGIQQFGVCHLSEQQVRAGFSEFSNFQCRFADCSHTSDPDCGVVAAVESGQVSQSRYRSYCGMLEELRSERRY